MKNITKNQKLAAITETTLIVAIDVGAYKHHARAFDWRGIEQQKKAFTFSNDRHGFESFLNWIEHIQLESQSTEVMVGLEPTGHYWFPLFEFLQAHKLHLVITSPVSVKQTKETSTNSASKSDTQDPKAIAHVMMSGNYQEVYRPQGTCAELRKAYTVRNSVMEQNKATVNRIHAWASTYFPEWHKVYSCIQCVSLLMVLRQAPLPMDIVELGVKGILKHWRACQLRGVGRDRAERLVEEAKRSVGITEAAEIARDEIQILLQHYDLQKAQLARLDKRLEQLVEKYPRGTRLRQIPGIDLQLAAGFLAEVGEISRFPSAAQLQSYAGLDILQNSSGKHKGRSRISRRGRNRLRRVMFMAALSVVSNTSEFRAVHEYYKHRKKNPLTPMQAMIAVACKLLRLFYAILVKGVSYDPAKVTLGAAPPCSETTQAA
ncbi:MAG: IS110 family transposase [Actinomycetaceae bacterium]|nr:IS110 family transposase [Actinomycetaceae bacterium]